MKDCLLVCLVGMTLMGSAQDTLQLKGQWKFKSVSETEWLAATVPGTVHTDLFFAGVIPDPFFGTNELDVQWIDTTEWEYTLNFNCTPQPAHEVYLVFEGLDTYADVYLNNTPVLKADNMFRTWRIPVIHLLGETNTLRIYFHSAVNQGKNAAKKLPYTLPGDEKVFTRKAAYHYGWDWGPRFVTAGIWQPVYLVAETEPATVYNQFLSQVKLTDAEANLDLQTTLRVVKPSTVEVSVFNASTNELLGKATHSITRDTTVHTPVNILNPKRWWCNGLGDPHLYRLKVTIENKSTGKQTAIQLRIGLRTIELVQQPDSLGKSFYFRLNGTSVFMKGANVIPPDNFLPRIDDAYYRKLVAHAREAHMTMLRVWGGGVYGTDAFYNACDEAGVLVWQDFMFANAMYPGDSAFLHNAKAEARDQIVRLRQHPSLALWCGNNEISEGWHNWGWQKQYGYSRQDSATIWNDYQKLFEHVLAEWVSALDTRPYHPSSPLHGWGRKKSMTEGDSHYWGVWWGMEPFEMYNNKVGRFMSEYGFQAMPSEEALAAITRNELSLSNNDVRHHQKHPKGFETIHQYVQKYYHLPNDFDGYRYLTQLTQAEGMKMAIEAHRRSRPHCMGTLYWQLNDCWPVTSWSSLDYTLTPKASHYFITRAFAPAITSVIKSQNRYAIYLVADHAGQYEVTCELKRLDGKRIFRKSMTLTTTLSGSFLVTQLDSLALLNNASPNNAVLVVTLYNKQGKSIDENHFYFVPPKELSLEKPELTFRVDARTQTLEVTSKNFIAKNVYLNAGSGVTFDANYFDLLPGHVKKISFQSSLPAARIQQQLTTLTVYDTFPH